MNSIGKTLSSAKGSVSKRSKFVASVSEVELFQGCRRRWRFAREWETRTVAPNLWLGIGIHYALEHYCKGVKAWPKDLKAQDENMLAAWNAWSRRELKVLAPVFGPLWAEAKPSYEGIIDLGRTILQNYLIFDRQAEIRFSPIQVERRLFLPMGERDLNNWLTAKMDLVARVTPSGLITVVDNKTARSDSHSGRSLELNEQGTGYV